MSLDSMPRFLRPILADKPVFPFFFKKMYARATHIVQGFDLPGFFPPLRADSLPGVQRHPDDPPEAPFKWFIDRVQTDPNVLLLEYGKFGDLHRLLNTAGYLGVLFPDKALWKIFRCCKSFRTSFLSPSSSLPPFLLRKQLPL